MPLRIITPWRLKLPDREAQKDRRQRVALADEVERFRRLVPKNRRAASLLDQQQREAFATPIERPERAVARGFGEAEVEGQFGPFREEDVIRIGARGAARFREALTTDPIPRPSRSALAEDTARAQQQAFAQPVGRQLVPPPEVAKRAENLRRVREALDAEGLSAQDFQVAVRAGLARQQGDELASYTLPREQRKQYNAVVQRLGVEGTPILAQGLPPETLRRDLEAQARERGVDPDQLFLESPAAFWDQLFAVEQEEIASRTRPKIEKALKFANVPAAETIAKFVAEVAVPSSVTPLGGFAKARAATRITARGIMEGTLNVMQDKAGRGERGEPPAQPFESAIMFAAGAVLGGLAPEVIGAFGRWIKTRVAAKTAQGVPQERAITEVIAEATDESGAVRQDILAELSRDPDLARDAVLRRQAISEAGLEGRPEVAEPGRVVPVEPVTPAPVEAAVPVAPARAVEPGAAVRQAAPAPPTVKTRTLFGEEVDTFATERELGGIREAQAGLPLEERPRNIAQNILDEINEERQLAREALASPATRRIRGETARLRTRMESLDEEERIIRDFVQRRLTPQQQADELAELRLDFADRGLRTARLGPGGREPAFGTPERTELEFGRRHVRPPRLRQRVSRPEAATGEALDELSIRLNLPEPSPEAGLAPSLAPLTRDQIVVNEATPGRQGPEAPITTADVDVRPVGGGALAPALMEGGRPVDLDLWRAIERGKITSERAGDLLRSVGERLSNVPGVARALKLGTGPQVIGRADPTTRAGLVYHTLWTIQDGERSVRMTRLRELVPDHWGAGQNAGEITINDRSVAMGDLGQAWLRGETETVQGMIGRGLLPEETAWFTEAQDYMRTLAAQWGAQTGNVHLAGDTVWPRFVKEADGSVRIRRPIGAKQSPLKVRVFETMEEGIRKEIPYTDPLQTMDLFGRALQKMTRDDILAKVAVEDDIGRIIDPKGLLDPEVVAATESARVGYRDASRARRAAEAESRAGRPITRAGARPAARGPAVASAREAEKAARRAWLVQRKKYTSALHAAQSRALSGRRGERPGISLGPGLSRIIFPEENLRTLESMLGPANVAMQSVARVAAVPRLTQAGLLDMAQGSIQMATVFYRRPGNWAKGMASGFREAFQPGAFQRWAAESPVARDAIAHDVQVVGSFEPVEAIVGGGLLEKAGQTRVGKVLTAFARAFDASIGVTKAWEYDALARISKKAGEPDDELFRIGSYVNTKLGTTNTREMGVSATQRAAESGFGFFSPRYTRSIPGFLAWTMSKGIPARDARESLFLLMLGGAGTFYGLARASGMSHDETVHRLDPRSRGQFMSIPVFGNEMGFGSAWRSYIKFMGDLARADSWDFDSWDDAALNNPLVRFLRSRTSPVTGTLMDFMTGADFIGREVSISQFIDSPELLVDYAVESILPFSIDAIMEARGGLVGKAATFAAEFAGGRSFPQSAFTRFEQAREDEFERRKGAGAFASFENYADLRASNRAAADEIDASQAVQEAQAELDESRARRPETETGRFFEARERVLEEFRQEQTEDDRNIEAFFRSGGEAGLDPKRWQELQGDRLGRSFERREGIRDAFQIEFERETGQAPKGSVNAAVEDYFAVDVERFTDPVTRDIDPAYYDARERAFADLAPEDRTSALAVINKNRTPLQREFENLRREPFEDGVSLDDYYDIPSEDRQGRDRWRRRNPQGDAILFVTGSVTTLRTAAARREAKSLVRRVFGSQAAIPKDTRGGRGRRTRRERRNGGVTFTESRPAETIDLRTRPKVGSVLGGLGQ